MPIRARRATAALFVLLITTALTVVPAAGQTPDASADTFALERLDGIQNAVSRTYAVDVASLTDLVTTPNADLEMPSGTALAIGIIAEFDTPENATAAVRAIGEDSFTGAGEDPAVEWTPVDDLGTSGIAHVGPITGGGSGALGVYVVQDGNWLYIAIVSSTDESADATARGVIEFALGRDAGPDETVFRGEGTSEGGPWAKLPSVDETQDDAEDNVFAGITPTVDTVIVPGEDASTPTT